MTTANNDSNPADNGNALKQQAACGPGCGCHAAGSGGKTRWIVGAIILVAAGVLAARAVVKNSAPACKPASNDFAALAFPALTHKPVAAVASTGAVAVAEIGALNDLNMVAVGTDGVFVYLPGTNGISTNVPAAQIRDAAKTIEVQARIKIGFFTLKADSADYAQLAGQMAVPGVLAMVKGRGMAPVFGTITEATLIQGFVAASSAGGCGAGGCGPAGCK